MEISGFFNAMKKGDTWDRVYKAENFAEYFATFIGNGVFPNPATGLQVHGSNGMNVVLKIGKAWINGFYYSNTTDLILPIDVADGVLNRIDKVVLRYDVVAREIRAYVKKGEYKSNPIAPEVTRNADMYELALADIQVDAGAIKISQSDITDLRLNKSLCGIVHGTVDQVDTTAIFNQFQSWYTQTQKNYDKDMATWTTNKKQAFNEWYTNNTTAFLERLYSFYNVSNTGFDKWFNEIKNKLDKDVAGHLQLQIDELLPTKELLTIQHNLNNYPFVRTLALKYGAGVGGAGESPAGGSNTETIPNKIIYLDKNNLKIVLQGKYSLMGVPLVEKVDNKNYIVTFEHDPISILIILN